jgi:hypothetical protein
MVYGAGERLALKIL